MKTTWIMAKRKWRLIRVKAAKFHIFISTHMCVCVCPVWRHFNEIVQLFFCLSNTFRNSRNLNMAHIWRVSLLWVSLSPCRGSALCHFKLGYLIINEVILQYGVAWCGVAWCGVVWVRLQLNSVLLRNCRRHGLCLRGQLHYYCHAPAYSIFQVFM